MPADKQSKRRWLRFSLATFLFVSLCIGGSIAGYQSGYRRGYNSGKSTQYNEAQVVETYSTISFIWPDLPEADRITGVRNLIDLIKSTIATDLWDDRLGNEIREFPANHSLIVTAPGSVQHEIRDLFAQLETIQNRESVVDLLPALQAMASIGKTQANVLDIKAPKDSSTSGIWLEKYFGATVKGVSKHWGSPHYEGKCTDVGFPQWSLDQRIATWQRGSGFSYLAIRYADDGQLHLVAGWRNNS